MANTTNFGWETPDDTDLVKDGALAMRTLGNAIDTSLVDLKGGTTGQVLSKNTNTDMDFVWTTPNVGDITEVQAGTGISVASGTGPIPVVTNTVATAYDAKGDLIVGTGADTFAKLTVGTNGDTLVADSSTATGLKWAAPAGGSTFAGCSLYNSGTQTIGNATWTALTFDSENFDSDAFHSTSTNTSRITIPSGKAGKYQFILRTQTTDNNTGARSLRLYKNGSDILEYESSISTRGSLSYQTLTVQNAIVGDYFEFFVYQTSGGNLTYSTTQKLTEFSASYLGA